MSATLEEVVAMLDLPTVDDVADLLRSHGIKGVPKDCARCPIALFAEQLTGRAMRVGLLHIDARNNREPSLLLRLPDTAREFIRCFDRRSTLFPDLVAP